MSQRTRINQKFLFTTFLLFLIAGYVINADIREDAARWPEDFFSFAVIGHIYPHLTTGGAEYIIRKINADNPSLVVVTGDSIPGADTRENARTQWDTVEKLFSSFRMPIYFVPGNHDLGSPA
ncbi:metallophosphoesterase, partial [Candidatus Uhrbacteria bacterium]|nr:metallophosphoesterase [Candidatus Uhrbacteria bacterium]